MTERRTADECRDEMRSLIHEAVEEKDLARRVAMLTLADHWSELVRLRRARDGAGPGVTGKA
jgi:hypothetical protein